MESTVHADPLNDVPRPGGFAARDGAGPGLYVHVPFCATRCTYCDFSSGSLSAAAVERYLSAIEREAERRAPSASGLEFRTVFFGGGTPSALSSRHFERVFRALRSNYRIAPAAEITLEANPESVKPSLLDTWRACGVNRLSMGAQSSHADEIASLGRIHDARRPAEALALARARGFERLSLDLMFAFPGHDLERWSATLRWALELDPGHLSAYCFIPEPGTPLGDRVLRREVVTPPDDEQEALYAELCRLCSAAGYDAYETSNFARPGQEARHNLGYWLRRPCLALGPSAHGFLDGERYGNHYALERWAVALDRGEAPEASRESIDGDEASREALLLGLRLTDGLSRRDVAADEWRRIESRYATAWRRAEASGRLERTALGWRIPKALRFLADDVIAWIDAEADRSATGAAIARGAGRSGSPAAVATAV
jgi:oxygen-independent coproporphyrinogen-3 oxidase